MSTSSTTFTKKFQISINKNILHLKHFYFVAFLKIHHKNVSFLSFSKFTFYLSYFKI